MKEEDFNEKVEAIIRPEKFKDLREKLSAIGFDGLTVTEAAGTGKQKGRLEYTDLQNLKLPCFLN